MEASKTDVRNKKMRTHFLSKFFGKKRKGKMGTKRIVRTEIGEGCAMRERMFPKD